ncbi:MAG: 4-alpha-glucanotransferase [Acidisphaera sp.]|nr:4-alpha-glucanotransferase [Acidisphaera sp.]
MSGTSPGDPELLSLAEAAGLAPRWRDAFGKTHDVAPATLRSVLAALDLPASSNGDVRDSLARLRRLGAELQPLVTAETNVPITLTAPAGRFRVKLEDGSTREGTAEARDGRVTIPPIDAPGYHSLEISDRETVLAVAPPRCFSVQDALPGGRPWGLAVQLYALRRDGDGGLGDFTALRDFVQSAGAHGAAAVAISPVHAQFSADPDRFSPYAPSSRVMLNVLHADAGGVLAEVLAPGDAERRLEALDQVDWPAAGRARLARFREVFERFSAEAPGRQHQAFAAFRAEQGEVLESHARFEALHATQFASDAERWNWRSWPEALRNPRSPEVARFAAERAHEVAFHAFLQFLADRSLAAAQGAARAAGMPIGLISDLAVGVDAGGSQSWSGQDETLIGLTIGAPPDLLNTQGQSWGLAAFSPRGLARNGFGAFLAMLRTALRHAGGVRIDHAMGLGRLWVLPEGASALEGAYLTFPLEDMLRLVALESFRHRAIVLGEDLGTVPEGFQDRLGRAGVMGMRVLWFERDEDRFRAPQRWSPHAAAMTSTHDLPTVAGWWSGRDLAWRKQLHLLGDERAEWFEFENRDRDRTRLWEAFRGSGAATGEVPPPEQPDAAVDAAVRHVGRAACELALVPIEDVLASSEQPNLPGTLHEHPNWRRRLPGPAASLLETPGAASRLASLADSRTSA